MKKDVLISITGLHYGDWNADGEEAEPIEVITPATYYLKNGKHYVIYDEIVEGMPGSIRNTVKITGDSMFEVTKNGRSGSRMVFEKDKMNMTNYQTPYGEVLVGIHTRDIQVHVEEENIDVEISYGLDVNEEAVSELWDRKKVKLCFVRNVGSRFRMTESSAPNAVHRWWRMRFR